MTEAQFPTNTAELLARIEQSWEALWAAVAGLTETQLETPDAGGWSIKDNLAHLTAWEGYMLRHYLQGEPAGQAMGLDEATLRLDIDELNAALFARTRDLSLSAVIGNAQAMHREVVEFLASAPFDSLARPRFADDPERRPMLAWIGGNSYEHYEEHLDAIRALAARGSAA